jgi:hypothetical protein
MSFDLGYKPEVYYYDFYRVPKFSLITEIPLCIYKKASVSCVYSVHSSICSGMTRLCTRLES